MMKDGKADNLAGGYSLGHYRIISKIGAGAMGEVFLAEDTKLDRKVADNILRFYILLFDYSLSRLWGYES